MNWANANQTNPGGAFQEAAVTAVPVNPNTSRRLISNDPTAPKASKSKSIKIATADTFIEINKAVTEQQADAMTQLLFEDISSQELLIAKRHNNVNGQDVRYEIIANMEDIQEAYDVNNILALGTTEYEQTENFGLDIGQYIPSAPTNSGGQNSFVYVDLETFNLIIEVANIATDERVEVEFLAYDTINNGIIDL
jgi:hypothetical protein